MKTQKAPTRLLKKQDRFTFGKAQMQPTPISDSTIIITTTVTYIFPHR